MGFKVGITCLKLARKRASNSRRSRTGIMRSVILEAMEERYSHDPDLDRAKTKDNEYIGQFRSGNEMCDYMEEIVEKYSEIRIKSGRKKIRETAGVGYAMIVKPSAEEINSWNSTKKRKFWRDSSNILGEILGNTVVGGVLQKDEGAEHMHLFGLGIVDGEICIDKFINPRLFERFNREYPEKMRKLGWSIDDCEKIPGQPEEEHGISAIAYKRKKNKQMADELAEKERALEARETAQDAAQAQIDAKMQAAEDARQRAQEAANAIIAQAKAEAERIINAAAGDAQRRQDGRQGLDRISTRDDGRSYGRFSSL